MPSVSFCVNCARVFLMLFGLLFLLFGFALFSLTLWIRFDHQIESQLRQTLLSDPALSPPELMDIKLEFRVAYVVLFWAFVGLSLALALVGFFALCGVYSQSRPIIGLLLVMLVLLVLLKLLLSLAVAFFHKNIMNRLGTYVTISQQFNLSDATVFRQRFICCGDGNYQMPYNYQCQGLGQPNCRQILEDGFAFVLAILAAFVGCAVLLELIAAILCALHVCQLKNDGTQIE